MVCFRMFFKFEVQTVLFILELLQLFVIFILSNPPLRASREGGFLFQLLDRQTGSMIVLCGSNLTNPFYNLYIYH